jgi:hypothetical protein
MGKLICVVTAFISLGATGCSSIAPRVSSMNFSPESMEILGAASGESSRGYLLCMIPMGDTAGGGVFFSRYSLLEAVNRSVASMKADALINTIAEQETGWAFPFWCWTAVRVQGIAVKFKQAPPK